jgi:hypothetical protein
MQRPASPDWYRLDDRIVTGSLSLLEQIQECLRQASPVMRRWVRLMFIRRTEDPLQSGDVRVQCVRVPPLLKQNEMSWLVALVGRTCS